MAKLFPSKQTFVDRGNGLQLLISQVKIISSTDYIDVANADDVQLIALGGKTARPTFYLTSNTNQVGIDGATVGTSYEVITSHTGMVNFKADQ